MQKSTLIITFMAMFFLLSSSASTAAATKRCPPAAVQVEIKTPISPSVQRGDIAARVV